MRLLALLFLVTVAAASAASAPSAASAASCKFKPTEATGIRGTAYKRLRDISTPEACCAACQSDFPACHGWELSRKTGEVVCNLKGASLGVSYPNTKCVSGRASPAPSPAPPSCPGARPRPSSSSSPATATALTAARRLAGASNKKQPHIFMFLQDDLGYDDVAFNGNEVNHDVTANITAAAKEGIVLKRHYVHWHCSPSRRTFLTGRLPLHHSEFLSSTNLGDDIDLRWTTIGQKLKDVGYSTFWFGKGHTGYKSYNHLPLQLGFDQFEGFLGGAMNHFGKGRFAGNCPMVNNTEYSATLYGDLALAALEKYDPGKPDAKPIFMYLPWQNVHAPYQAPLDWDGDVLRGMLSATDGALGKVVNTLKKKGMWDNSLLLYSADNGGTDRGSNWPLRGGKHTNWEGGMRAAAFVSGGLVPKQLRGTTSNVVGHIADWYTTVAVQAGADPTDDSPIKPLPVDPANPKKDIYSNGAFPGVDGVDLWPAWVTRADPSNASAAHPDGLWLSEEVMVLGKYKLVVSQQDPAKTNSGPTFGWKCGGSKGKRCDTTTSTSCGENPDTKPVKGCNSWVKATDEQCKCGCAYYGRDGNPTPKGPGGTYPRVPCLFDVEADASEFTDITSKHLELRNEMWRKLNLSNLELFQHRADTKDPSADKTANRSPAKLVGNCNASCASAYWEQYVNPKLHPKIYSGGPTCGVPGC